MPDKPIFGRRRSTGPRTRALVGIELPKELKEHISKIQQELPRGTLLESPDNLLINLIYLGHIAQERLSAAYRVVRPILQNVRTFEVSTSKLDYLYSGETRDHSVIYLSIKDPDKNIQNLFNTITKALSEEEFSPPHRLHPHIEIAQVPKQRDRNAQAKNLEEIVEKEMEDNAFIVNHITFFQELRGGGVKPLLRLSLRGAEGDEAIS
ncbi:MAG: 2'-5' RNA ligase family protein [Patescibacteria group bacterium]